MSRFYEKEVEIARIISCWGNQTLLPPELRPGCPILIHTWEKIEKDLQPDVTDYLLHETDADNKGHPLYNPEEVTKLLITAVHPQAHTRGVCFAQFLCIIHDFFQKLTHPLALPHWKTEKAYKSFIPPIIISDELLTLEDYEPWLRLFHGRDSAFPDERHVGDFFYRLMYLAGWEHLNLALNDVPRRTFIPFTPPIVKYSLFYPIREIALPEMLVYGVNHMENVYSPVDDIFKANISDGFAFGEHYEKTYSVSCFRYDDCDNPGGVVNAITRVISNMYEETTMNGTSYNYADAARFMRNLGDICQQRHFCKVVCAGLIPMRCTNNPRGYYHDAYWINIPIFKALYKRSPNREFSFSMFRNSFPLSQGSHPVGSVSGGGWFRIPPTLWYAFPYGTKILARCMFGSSATINENMWMLIANFECPCAPRPLPRNTRFTRNLYNELCRVSKVLYFADMVYHYEPNTIPRVIKTVTWSREFNFPLHFVRLFITELLREGDYYAQQTRDVTISKRHDLGEKTWLLINRDVYRSVIYHLLVPLCTYPDVYPESDFIHEMFKCAGVVPVASFITDSHDFSYDPGEYLLNKRMLQFKTLWNPISGMSVMTNLDPVHTPYDYVSPLVLGHNFTPLQTRIRYIVLQFTRPHYCEMSLLSPDGRMIDDPHDRILYTIWEKLTDDIRIVDDTAASRADYRARFDFYIRCGCPIFNRYVYIDKHPLHRDGPRAYGEFLNRYLFKYMMFCLPLVAAYSQELYNILLTILHDTERHASIEWVNWFFTTVRLDEGPLGGVREYHKPLVVSNIITENHRWRVVTYADICADMASWTGMIPESIRKLLIFANETADGAYPPHWILLLSVNTLEQMEWRGQ